MFGASGGKVSEQSLNTEFAEFTQRFTGNSIFARRAMYDAGVMRPGAERATTVRRWNSVLLAPKILADRGDSNSCSHFRQLLGIGIARGYQCSDRDAPCIGEEVAVGVGQLADQVMRSQQGQLACDRGGLAALLRL